MLIIYTVLAECPGSLLLMNRDKHHFSFSSSFQNADFISTLQFTTKTRITSELFLIHIYIQQCPNLSLGLDHCCLA